MDKLSEKQCKFVEWTYMQSDWHFDERYAKWRDVGGNLLTTNELYEKYQNEE